MYGRLPYAMRPYNDFWLIVAAAGGITYPELERYIRGVMRGVAYVLALIIIGI